MPDCCETKTSDKLHKIKTIKGEKCRKSSAGGEKKSFSFFFFDLTQPRLTIVSKKNLSDESFPTTQLHIAITHILKALRKLPEPFFVWFG